MDPSIELSVLRAPDHVRAAVRGELDIATAGALSELLAPLTAEAPPLLVLDLGELRFLDASGLRVLTAVARALSGAGGRLVLARPSPMLRTMLDVLELEPVLPVLPVPPTRD